MPFSPFPFSARARRGRRPACSFTRLSLVWLAAPCLGQAQLPVAQLETVFPAGCQQGGEITIQLQGSDLDELDQVLVSHPNIHGEISGGNQAELRVGNDVPPGIYDVWASGRFGFSNPRAFLVTDSPQGVEVAPNQEPSQAMPIRLGQTVQGRAANQAQDWFCFTAPDSEPLRIDVLAQRIDSRMDAAFTLFDENGKEILRAQDELGRDPSLSFSPIAGKTYRLSVHDFLYRGGDAFVYALHVAKATASPHFRAIRRAADLTSDALSSSPIQASEMQTVSDIPAEFRGCLTTAFHRFDLPMQKDARVVVDVFSDRLGAASDLHLTAYRLQPKDDGSQAEERIGDADDTRGQPGGPLVETEHRDPQFELKADRDATYRIEIADHFASNAPYQIVFRRPEPNFDLVVALQSATDKERKVSRWSSFLRRGGTLDWRVFLLRQDGFNGAVNVRVENLPAGVRAFPLVIPEGQNDGRLILAADAEGEGWSGLIRILGEAKRSESEGPLLREAHGATVLWTVADTNNEVLETRLAQGIGLRVASEETEPLVVEPADETEFTASIAGQLEIPLKVTRTAEQAGNFTLSPTGIPGMANPPKAAIEPGTESVTLKLDLANKDNNQFRPGTHDFVIKAEGGKIKYRANPQALERAEAALQQAEEAVAEKTALVEANPEDAEAKAALEQAKAARDEATKVVEAAKNRANLQELEHACYSTPFRLTITPLPIALAEPAESLQGTPGSTVTVPIRIERLYGFQEAVELVLTPPENVPGLSQTAGQIPKDSSESNLSLAVGPEAPAGTHRFTLTVKLTYNGQPLEWKREWDLTLVSSPSRS